MIMVSTCGLDTQTSKQSMLVCHCMNFDVSREHEGDWKWSDLSSGYVYKHWDQNEPDGGDMENCAFMHMETGAWRDTNCLDKHTFICKVIVF